MTQKTNTSIKAIIFYGAFIFFPSICIAQCDCTIFPVKQECYTYCLGHESKEQLQKSFKLDTQTADAIAKIKDRKNLKTVAEFKRHLSSTASKKLAQQIAEMEHDDVGKLKSSAKSIYPGEIPLIVLGGNALWFTYEDPEQVGDLSEINKNLDFQWWLDQNGDLKINATIRDKDGNIMAKIEANEWMVGSQCHSWDKNFSKNALEVLDSKGDVAIQVELTDSAVFLAGTFYNKDGSGGIMFVPGKYVGEDSTGILIGIGKGQNPSLTLDPIFKYPSKFHKGERNENTISGPVPKKIFCMFPELSEVYDKKAPHKRRPK